ncbi:SPOR domain-containing protein [Pseudogulbenkiania sp. MAI-1]|uniref:SPOR domain-containing protein n=1 Tax=Pseudogulbenkiania sp. MAI-1 TaxID=990370 RepID=UPI00045E92C8|nr:SPOR domain-containing protein [Pseudogulbenkiania sp. MAI-1]
MPGLSTHEELILLRKRARRRLVGAIVLVLISTVVLWQVVGSVPEQQMKPESVEIVGQKSPETAPAPAVPAPEAVLAPSAEAVPQENRTASAATVTQLPAQLDDAGPAATAQPAAKPQPAAAPPVVAKAEPKAAVKEEAKPLPRAEPKPESRPEPKKAEAPAPRKVDPAAILEGRVEAEPTAAKPAPKAESKPEAGKGNVVIQLAALSDPGKAEALKARLSGLGVTAHFSKVETSKGNVTRVRVGPFGSRAEAESILKKLSSAGVTGIIVSR